MADVANHEFVGLTSLLRHVFGAWEQNRLQTSQPGTVVSYNSATQTVNLELDLGTGTELRDVPVLFPGSKAGMLAFEIAAGDRVWVFWSKLDLFTWRSQGYRRTVGERNVLDFASVVCIPWALNSDNLLERILPEGGTAGQILERTADGYRWIDKPTTP